MSNSLKKRHSFEKNWKVYIILLMKKIFLIIVSVYVSLVWVIIFEGLFDDKIIWDRAYGIIYGNKVERDGSLSNRLEARLVRGLELYDKGIIQVIIVSGGVWIEWFDEAQVMSEYLIDHWVIEEDVIVDSDWYTTESTSENSFEIISRREEDINEVSIVWISQYFHILRVKLSLNNSWFKTVYWVSPVYFELRDMYSLFREVPAYLKYTFF